MHTKNNYKNFIIAANWKMNGSLNLCESYIQDISLIGADIEFIIFPPNLYIHYLIHNFEDTNIKVGAQDCSKYSGNGNYTGQISPELMEKIRASYVIIGHYEHYQYGDQKIEDVKEKLNALQKTNIKTILCVGETYAEKQGNLTLSVIDEKLAKLLAGIDDLDNILIAYEPIWAIGSDVQPNVSDIHQVVNFIKDKYSNVNVLYGGSVNEDNIDNIINVPDLNGVLVGGTSLHVEKMNLLINKVVHWQEKKENIN